MKEEARPGRAQRTNKKLTSWDGESSHLHMEGTKQPGCEIVGERGKGNSPFSHLGGFPVQQRRGGAYLKLILRSSKRAGGRRDASWKNGRQLGWDFSLLASRSASGLLLL